MKKLIAISVLAMTLLIGVSGCTLGEFETSTGTGSATSPHSDCAKAVYTYPSHTTLETRDKIIKCVKNMASANRRSEDFCVDLRDISSDWELNRRVMKRENNWPKSFETARSQIKNAANTYC